MSTLDYLELCRLCLVKDRVSVPIFEDEGDVRQIFLKIAACLPVKVTREDKLPKKICDDCAYKVELFYQFWNTTANAEKQLLEWLGEVNLQDKQSYVTDVLDPNVLKQEQISENRLDGNVIRITEHTHQNNMGMGIMENMGLGMPIVLSTADQQRISSTALNTSGSAVQNVQGVPGSSGHDQIQTHASTAARQEDEEETSEDEENSDEECDGDDGLVVKAESEEDPNTRVLEPTTFVNVSIACDEAGPSGLQQQKIPEIPDMAMPQSADGDPKPGYFGGKIALSQHHDQLGEEQHNPEIIISERIIQCGLCGDGFVSENDLRAHLSSHEQQQRANEYDDETYVCEHCGCSFPTTTSLLEHQEEEHEQDSNDSGRADEQNSSYHCDRPFQCEICHATFRYRQGLRLHAKLHQPGYVPPQKKHHCELCNKRFSRKQVLLVHMKTHGNVGGPQHEYVCPVCGKAVSSKTYLTVHLRKHTGEKPHVCDLCGKAFISQNYLSVHRRTHTGERPHKCTHCEKRFTQRTTLVVHLRGHTGDRPYPCTCCHKSFASKTMLNSHLKTHAKQTARQQLERQQQHQIQQQEQHQRPDDEQSLDSTVTILLPS